jgi:hypothetical protein
MENGKKIVFSLAITLAVVANLLLANNVSAEQFTISESDIKQIKSVLDLSGILSEVMVSDAKLKTILNLAIRGGGTGADITYGLLVLTSLNEMDFIDMVVSQRYKTEADAYFNSVLDKRLNIASYYKGTAFDAFRVASGRIPSPMAALTLNSFDITDKAIETLTAFNNFKLVKFYDGLWYYFDLRKSNENHTVAWSDARDAMGFAIESPIFSRKLDKNDEFKIEAQFATLYDKWGPYVEINKGVKEEFKEQVKQELQNTLALAAEEQVLAEKEKENQLSFLEKMKIILANLMKEASRAMARIQELAGFGGAQVSQAPAEEIADKEEIVSQLEISQLEIRSPILETNPEMTTGELQEILDDIAEKIDIISQKVAELTGQKSETVAENSSPRESLPTVQDQQTPDQTPAVVFNYGAPTVLPAELPPAPVVPEPEPTPEPEPETPLLTVVINEIAWAGTKANSADEWIELYNNTTSTIDLTGWILSWNRGTTSHSLVFSTSTGANIAILENGYYLLERTDDDPIKDIAADYIYPGALNNTGEKLELRDGQNNLIDFLDFSEGWPAGSSAPNYISMERINSTSGATSSNWANNNLLTRNGQDADGNKINGTPRAQNSVSVSSTAISGLLFDEFPEITLTYLGSPYLVQDDLTIPEGKTLKIEPNVIVKLKGNSGSDYSSSYNNSNLTVKGKLLAQGQAGKEIIFTSFLTPSGSIGWWGQIYFASSSQGSVLDYVQARYGGKKETDAYLILADSASITLKNSILENFAISGLSLVYSSSTIENLTIQSDHSGEAIRISGGSPTIKKSIFKNTYAGMIIGGGSTALIEDNTFEGIIYPNGSISVSDSYPAFKNNTAVDNALNGIYISGAINQNWTLNKDLPYVINNTKVSENVILTVEPGAIIKFLVNGRLDIDGTLNASSLSEKIVFASLCDDEYGGKTRGDTSPYPCGYWDRIYFSPLGQNSVLKNVVINHGGVAPWWATTQGAIYVSETKVEFEDLLMKNSGSYGLYIENSPETVVADSRFENIPVAIQIAGECPRLSGLTFESYSYTILPEECQP